MLVALFTDYGWNGPYVGQVKAALHLAGCGGAPLVDLMHDAPAFDPRASGHLLAALLPHLPTASVLLAVVDPGVGGERRGAVARVDGRWLVGPDNGLFDPALRNAAEARWWDIEWPRCPLSASFHGRDLFAPVAAMLARGEAVPGVPVAVAQRLWPGGATELAELVYIDGFGNAMTGLPAPPDPDATLEVHGRCLHRARTFSDWPPGELFWYANSIGLAEVAANSASAAGLLGLAVGDPVSLSARPAAGR